MISKEDRYGLKVRTAMALHDHRTGTDVTVHHSDEDEWWCCVEAITRVTEAFLEEATEGPSRRVQGTVVTDLRPRGLEHHGVIRTWATSDISLDDLDLDGFSIEKAGGLVILGEEREED